jgi:hypothetical protein
VPISDITGNIGVSPIAWSHDWLYLDIDSSRRVFDFAGHGAKPLRQLRRSHSWIFFDQAVSDMRLRTPITARLTPMHRGKNIGGGTIGGETFYLASTSFSAGVTIASDITFEGGP